MRSVQRSLTRSRPASCYLWRPEDDAEHAHDHKPIVSLKRRNGFHAQSVLANFPDIVAVRQVLMDGLTAVKVLTRYTARCWPCRTVPRLPSRAPGTSGTLNMALGKLVPNRAAPRVRKEHVWIFKGLRVTHSCYGRRRGTPAEALFPRMRRFPKVRMRGQAFGRYQVDAPEHRSALVTDPLRPMMAEPAADPSSGKPLDETVPGIRIVLVEK